MPKLKLSLIPSHSSCSLKAVLPRKSSADNLDEPEHVIDLNIDFSKKNKPVITANKLPTSAQVTTQVVNLSKQPSQSDIYDKHANHELKEADLKLKSFSLHSIEKRQQSDSKKSSMPPLPAPKLEKQEKTNRLLLSSDLKKPQPPIAPTKSADKLTQTPKMDAKPCKAEPQAAQSPSYFNNVNNKTANIDSLINSLLKQVEKTKLEQQSQAKKETPILDAITSFSADFVTEYKTCINVGNEFTSNDITVQLVDDQNNAKKLYVHCYRLEPVSARSVTLSAGQLPSKMDVSYANANGHNYLRKELKKEISIPANADINTMESYLENGSLVIKCLLHQSSSAESASLPAHLQTALNQLPSTSVNAELTKLSQPNVSQRQKSSIISEFELSNGPSQSPEEVSELEYATAEHDYARSHYNANRQYCEAARHSKRESHPSSCVFENPLYNSAKLDAESASSKPILKANSLNLLEHDEMMYVEEEEEEEEEYVARKAAARAKQNEEDLLVNYLKREEAAAKKTSSKKSGSGKKRRYKSNDCLLDDYSMIEKSSHRRTSLANLDGFDKTTVYRPRPQSASSVGSGNNAVTKSVRFDMSNKTMQIKESEDKAAKRNRNARHHHHRHRSSRSVDHTLNGGKQRTSSSNSIINSSQTSHLNQINRLSGDLIQDGYNCITKDGLDNIFLTYFFKLPSCSPADRTQARIEHHNILKLKIIQEKSFSTPSKSKKKASKSSSRSKAQKPGRNHKAEQESAAMQSSGSTSSSVKSLLSQSPTLSSSSSSTSPFSNSTSLSLSSLSTSVESDDSLTCFNDETSKIMLREFSRQCRLPDHLFKFDETGVTVSFVNNVWVRVEIPIVDFLEPIIDLKSSSSGGKKKQINNEKQYDINSSSSNNFGSKQKANASSANTAFLASYQTESDSVDFKPSGKSAKNILNYFEDKNDADVQI